MLRNILLTALISMFYLFGALGVERYKNNVALSDYSYCSLYTMRLEVYYS